jgi:hypothetical protein
MLKAPKTKRLKLKDDALLSTFAFKFSWRRYNTDENLLMMSDKSEVGRCRLTLSNPC